MNDGLGTRKVFSFIFFEIPSLFLGLIFPTFDNDQKYFPFLLPLPDGNNIASMMINIRRLSLGIRKIVRGGGDPNYGCHGWEVQGGMWIPVASLRLGLL